VTDLTPAARLGDAISHSPLGIALRESLWLYPTVETLHIVGFALLFGSIVVLDLRLLGLRRNVALRPLVSFVLPITLSSLLLVVPTGLLLFAAHANDLIGNRAFVVKMGLLFFAAINALMFHAGPYRAELEAAPGTAPRIATRCFAALSIALWVAVLVAGRLIEYV
jgi:hypothetical protein